MLGFNFQDYKALIFQKSQLYQVHMYCTGIVENVMFRECKNSVYNFKLPPDTTLSNSFFSQVFYLKWMGLFFVIACGCNGCWKIQCTLITVRMGKTVHNLKNKMHPWESGHFCTNIWSYVSLSVAEIFLELP